MYRRASHFHDEQELPHFRADLLQQLRDEAADDSDDGSAARAHAAPFAEALQEQIAPLGYPFLDSASLPSQPHLLVRLLGVRVPYPTTGDPSATLPLLLELLSSSYMSQRLGQGLFRRRGPAELQRRWLQGSGWPLLTVHPLRWHQLMALQASDRPAMLE